VVPLFPRRGFFMRIAKSNVMKGSVKSTAVRRSSDTVIDAAARSAICIHRHHQPSFMYIMHLNGNGTVN